MSSLPELDGLSTAAVSDALDGLGRPGALLGLTPLLDGCPMAGRAFTVGYRAADRQPGTVGDYLDDVTSGQVVVLDNRGRCDATVWGDILTAMADNRRVAGTVIDGVNRDVRRALDLSYPIYSRGRFMRTGKDRVQVDTVGETVAVCGVAVSPGDLVFGDDDGVVVIPRDCEQQVLERAREISDREAAIVDAVCAGGTLAQARADQGYHSLQRGGA